MILNLYAFVRFAIYLPCEFLSFAIRKDTREKLKKKTREYMDVQTHFEEGEDDVKLYVI